MYNYLIEIHKIALNSLVSLKIPEYFYIFDVTSLTAEHEMCPTSPSCPFALEALSFHIKLVNTEYYENRILVSNSFIRFALDNVML